MPRLAYLILALAGPVALSLAAYGVELPEAPKEFVMPEMPDLDRFERLAKTSPPPVSGFVERAMECFHWAGEEPYDRARAHQIVLNMERLNCDGLAQESLRLRRRFAGDTAAIQLLDEVEAGLFSIY